MTKRECAVRLDCGCIGGCRILFRHISLPSGGCSGDHYEITEEGDGDKYFFADWSEELSEALKATNDQGEHTDKLFEMVRPFADG